ncbi:predicted protein [Histoplasma capsulatum G186AR]|uniref:Uncharacterized protein n=1 Tax=Ajellomyces capsulatus (strain G186AR / H82 / ATCC MYA-2454 / RMSCC 2432) TaxID=447093 RepID=C0NB78_AJECG|nr:uncharacterized protein HCBG_00374 [Histoplasma capsulatum G186AR]EEH10919.1 predicted protein [Histoplasma capsulatum G186AR]
MFEPEQYPQSRLQQTIACRSCMELVSIECTYRSVVCAKISEEPDIVTVDEFGGMSQLNLQETRVTGIRGKFLAPLMFSMRLAVEALQAAQNFRRFPQGPRCQKVEHDT